MIRLRISKKVLTLLAFIINLSVYSQFSTTAPGGASALFNAGNVNIGTTVNGTNRLNVTGNSLFTGNSVITGTGQIANLGLGVAPNITYRLNVSGNSLFTGNSIITGTGQIANLGLGVAPNTTYRLNVQGNSLFTGTLWSTGNVGIGTSPSATTSTKLLISSGTTGISGLSFSNLNSSFATTSLNNNKVLTVDATGNVILSKDIDNIVHNLTGNNLTTTINGVTSNSIALPSIATNSYWSTMGNTSTATDFIGTINNQSLKFYVNNAQRLEITNGGSFRVNNTSGGNSNLFFGNNAGNDNNMSSISANTSFGNLAMSLVTSGFSNSAFGHNALHNNTTGYVNTAIGGATLTSNTSGNFNTALGNSSLYYNTTGESNTASGSNSLTLNTNGSYNTSNGFGAMYYNISGSNNTALGYNSGYNSTGHSNVFLGNQAGYNLTSGNNNVFIGSNAYPNISISSSNQLNIADKIYGSGINSTVAIGIGVQNPQARLHTNGSLRFEGLTNAISPNSLLGTDVNGNVYKYDPSSFVNLATTNVLSSSGNTITSNVNGVASNTSIINSINNTIIGDQFTTTINGVSSNIITLPSSSINNIYNTSGFLTSPRQLTLNNYPLTFTAIDFKTLMHPNSLSTTDESALEVRSYNNPIYPNLTGHGFFKINQEKSEIYLTQGTNENSSWIQSSRNPDGETSKHHLTLNPLGGNVGIGLGATAIPTAQFHTNHSVRFENLPTSTNPNAILGTDINGNVYNYDPSLLGSGSSQDAWLLNGNAATIPGTGLGENFIGTTDNKDLVFGVNSNEKMRITQTGRLKFFNSNTSPMYSENLFIGGGNDNISSLAGGYNYANVAVGLASLSSNTTGYANTVVGYNALRSNLTSNLNSTLGINSMQNHTTGDANCSIGHNSMKGNTTGSNNSAMGNSALYNNLTGSDNVAIGSYAGVNLINGNNNIFIGSATQPTSNTTYNELNIGNWIFGKNGKIAIGSFSDLPQAFITNSDYQLIVKQGIRTEKVRVDIASVKNWADYVFKKDYKLMTLNELENYIKINGHLPNIPNAEQVVQEGIDLGAMNSKLLEKVEELTLHAIELNKKNESQQKTIDNLIERLEQLEKNAKQ